MFRQFNGHHVVTLQGAEQNEDVTWAFQVRTQKECVSFLQVMAHPAQFASYIWRGPQGEEIAWRSLERYKMTVEKENVKLVIYNPTLADMGPYPIEVGLVRYPVSPGCPGEGGQGRQVQVSQRGDLPGGEARGQSEPDLQQATGAQVPLGGRGLHRDLRSHGVPHQHHLRKPLLPALLQLLPPPTPSCHLLLHLLPGAS